MLTLGRWHQSVISNILAQLTIKNHHFFNTLSTMTQPRTHSLSKQVPFADSETALINLTPFPSLYCSENVLLRNLFATHGFELRIAGGAVRDVLLGVEPKDIDFATDATPDQMNEMFLKEGIRTLNRNGEAHGTVTVRINDKINFEVTTLRIDYEPDGRHAKVVFTNDWKLDAARRDLTVNSMFLDSQVNHTAAEKGCGSPSQSVNSVKMSDSDEKAAQGEMPNPTTVDSVSETQDKLVYGRVFDYFGGREDLTNRRIRFVGDAVTRIREDYLRILRYFRFHGRLARSDEKDWHDEDTLKAIASNAVGIGQIAGERCWQELKSILLFPSTPALLRRMFNAGLFSHLGLPAEPNFTELDYLWKRGILSRQPNSVTCLVAILSTPDELEALNERLKLSNMEIMIMAYILKNRKKCSSMGVDEQLDYFKRELLLSKEAPNKLLPVLTEMMHYLMCDDTMVMTAWSKWQPPRFPINGHDLQSQWSIQPRFMRNYLVSLRRQWVDSDCQLSMDDLLSDSNRSVVEQLVQNVEPESYSRKAKKARR